MVRQQKMEMKGRWLAEVDGGGLEEGGCSRWDHSGVKLKGWQRRLAPTQGTKNEEEETVFLFIPLYVSMEFFHLHQKCHLVLV